VLKSIIAVSELANFLSVLRSSHAVFDRGVDVVWGKGKRTAWERVGDFICPTFDRVPIAVVASHPSQRRVAPPVANT